MSQPEYMPQTFRIRSDLADRLEQYRKKSGVTKTFTIEKALEEHLNKVFPEGDKHG